MSNNDQIESTEYREDEVRHAKSALARFELEEDPHRAALEDNPDKVHVSLTTWASIAFLSLSFGPALGLAFQCFAAVEVEVVAELDPGGETTWIVGAWSLASAVSLALAGTLSDVFGRRYPILFGQLLTLVGAIAMATAKGLRAIVAGEALIGFGSGLMFVSYAGVPEMLPNKWRALGMSLLEMGIAVPWGLASVLIGNSIFKHLGWRWIPYLAIIVESVALVGTAICYWPPVITRGDEDITSWKRIKSLDYLGLVLFGGGLTTFLIGLTWGGTADHAWKSVGCILPIVLGFIAFCLGFVWEAFAKNPLFPPSLLRQFYQFTVLLAAAFVAGMNFYSMAALLPQGSLYMFSPDPTQIGLISLPNNLMAIALGVVLPMFSHKIKYMKYQLICSLFLQLVFVAASAGAVAPNNKVAWMILPALGVPTFGWTTTLTYAIASLHVPHSRLGAAIGLLGTIRATGGAVGNSIFSTIFRHSSTSHAGKAIAGVAFSHGFSPKSLPELIPAVIEYNIGIPTNGLLEIPGVTPQLADTFQSALRNAYGQAFKLVFLCTIPFGALALLCAFFVEDSTQYMTNHIQLKMPGRQEHGATDEVEKVAATARHEE